MLACEKNIANGIDIFFPTIVMVMTVKVYGSRCGASVATVATGLAKCMCLGYHWSIRMVPLDLTSVALMPHATDDYQGIYVTIRALHIFKPCSWPTLHP